MKKRVRLWICMILAIFLLCGCSGKSEDNSIVGKWTVTAYELNGEIVSKDDVGEVMGEVFASIERPVLLFQKSGLVRIYKPSDNEKEYTVNYTVTEETIELYQEDKHMAYLVKEDGVLKMDIDSNICLIYTKE